MRLPRRSRGLAMGVAALVTSPLVPALVSHHADSAGTGTLVGNPVLSTPVDTPVQAVASARPLEVGSVAEETPPSPSLPSSPPASPARAVAASQPQPVAVAKQPDRTVVVASVPAAVKAAPVPMGGIVGIITAAALRHGVSPAWMLRIARCESGLNPRAVNPRGGYTGLFQFAPSTFRGNGGRDIYDPVQQAEVTATMLSHGQAHQWSCA